MAVKIDRRTLRKGLTYTQIYGEDKAREIKDKSSNSHKGQIPANIHFLGKYPSKRALGYKHSKEWKEEASKRMMGNKLRLNKSPWNSGTGKSDAAILKRNRKRLGITSGVIHHIDGNHSNNTISNLQVLKNQSEHAKLHGWGRREDGKFYNRWDGGWQL